MLSRFTSKTHLAIEIDLRQPSMLHGKKGFERIVWACRNVLNASVTWLLACDAVSQNSLDKGMMNHYIRCRGCLLTRPSCRCPPEVSA